MPPATHPILLFDGHCPLCNGLVRRLLAHDRRGTLRFAPLDGDTAEAVRERHPELTGVDSVVLVREPGTAAETILVRSAAALAVARQLGGPWRLLTVLRILPRSWRDRLYDWVARHRESLFGRCETCPLPTADQNERFLP